MILAGDVGGTKTRLAIFEPRSGELAERWSATYPSREASGLVELVRRARDESGLSPRAACIGIAGPVDDGRGDTTNLPWDADEREVARALDLDSSRLLNDLEATAWGLATLPGEAFHTLLAGEERRGNAGVLAAGTGLGQAGLFWDGERHRPFACEGGHVDFAPGNELEARLFLRLRERHGHVSWERVLSGPGLVELRDFLREQEAPRTSAREPDADDAGDAPTIARAAERGDPLAIQALTSFVELYGRAAGNVALSYLARGGIYLAGGIAPKSLAWLERPEFRAGFLDKGRLADVLERIPVRVVLDDRTAVYGAARAAALDLGICDRDACRILRA